MDIEEDVGFDRVRKSIIRAVDEVVIQWLQEEAGDNYDWLTNSNEIIGVIV